MRSVHSATSECASRVHLTATPAPPVGCFFEGIFTRELRMPCKSLLLVMFLSGCLSAPVDDPIRIDLPVYDEPQVVKEEPRTSARQPAGYDAPLASSDVQVSQGILPENHPGGEPDLTAGGNFISYKLQQANSLLGNTLDSKPTFLGPFAPVTKLESAMHETEGLGSRALSVKENLHSFVAGIFQPKPIVDTIDESDKYGNTGDKFYTAGQVFVKGASNVSNLVNSILEIPGALFKTIARSTTEKLNNVGAKLVGL